MSRRNRIQFNKVGEFVIFDHCGIDTTLTLFGAELTNRYKKHVLELLIFETQSRKGVQCTPADSNHPPTFTKTNVGMDLKFKGGEQVVNIHHRPTTAGAFKTSAKLGKGRRSIHSSENRNEPEYRLQPQTNGHCLLTISGHADPHWIPRLCGRLFEEQVNIVAAKAHIDDANRLCARFDLQPTRPGKEGYDTEFVESLKDGIPGGLPNTISITDYRVEPSTRFIESIHLRFKGLDRLGFLWSFFQSIAPLRLHMRRMESTTKLGVVDDQFWFVANRNQSREKTIAKLQNLLDSMVDYYWAN